MGASGTRVVEAPAKVNLFLRVHSRRADGFHELETLFQAVDLCDRVEVVRGGDGVRLEVEGPDLGPLHRNLAHRAAEGFLSRLGGEGRSGAGEARGVLIRLRKRIPAGAGLGGGSSDAAAVLRGMNALWGAPLDADTLSEVGAGLGSDVPFFLGESSLALGTGRGEVLRPLPPLPPTHLVLVLPPVHVATGPAYAALARHRESYPIPRRDPWDPGTLTAGWRAVAEAAENDFEAVVPASHPEVAASLDALRRAGASPALLSGSGGACFGVFRGRNEATRAAAQLSEELGWPTVPVRTLQLFQDPGG